MFQACAAVNVKTGGIFFLRITQNGESVQILSVAVSCATDLMTSHAWLKSKSHLTVMHAFVTHDILSRSVGFRKRE